jgi:hypothetical protein
MAVEFDLRLRSFAANFDAIKAAHGESGGSFAS